MFVISKKSGNILTNEWLFAPFYFSLESISVKQYDQIKKHNKES